MANVVINDPHLKDIADAIREKNGTSNTYAPNEMAAAITSLSSGGKSKMAYATISASSTTSSSKTFDLNNYIGNGMFYFIIQAEPDNGDFVVIINQAGRITEKRFSMGGSIVEYDASIITQPNFTLANGILTVGFNDGTEVRDKAAIIYMI